MPSTVLAVTAEEAEAGRDEFLARRQRLPVRRGAVVEMPALHQLFGRLEVHAVGAGQIEGGEAEMQLVFAQEKQRGVRANCQSVEKVSVLMPSADSISSSGQAAAVW